MVAVVAEGAGGADSAMVDFSRRGFVVSNDVATSLHNMFDNGVNQPLDPKIFDGKRSSETRLRLKLLRHLAFRS